MTTTPSSALAPFRAALFDMDGLLLDTERLITEAAERAARALALDDLEPTFRAMIGLRGDRAMPMLERALGERVTLEAFREEWSVHMGELERGGVPVRPGVVALLERLAARDLPCAVATSTRRAEAMGYLERADLARFFRTVTGGDDVVEPKPDPEIYRRAAASLGADARDCCAFEDSEPGTRAAIASGATVVQVPDLVPPSDALRALGHVIAPDILTGARQVRLVE